MNELEYMNMQIESLRKNYRVNLIRYVKSLKMTLDSELKQLENDPNYTPSGCGIIQGAGKVIDDYCVQLRTLNMIKEDK